MVAAIANDDCKSAQGRVAVPNSNLPMPKLPIARAE
jgi:hypothetical protein